MSVGLSFGELMEYTEWERGKWYEWFRARGGQGLGIHAGPHGDGRFQVVGDLVRHIFSGEKRYVERLQDLPITDTSGVPNNNVEALFEFGRQSRADLRRYIAAMPGASWEAPQDLSIMNYVIRTTPRKIVAHTLTHEIRHWAQITTLLRLNGMTGDFHDFLFSPVLGGEFKKV